MADTFGSRSDATWANVACADAEVVHDGVPGATTHSILIAGARCRTASELFTEWADKLRFPRYFGHNWDAFDECLDDYVITTGGGLGAEFGDREGIPADAVVITVEAAENTLIDEPADLPILVQVCRRAAASVHGVPVKADRAELHVIWQTDPAHCPQLERRLRSAGLDVGPAIREI